MRAYTRGEEGVGSNTAEFYPQHWKADGYGTAESDAFQVEIFRKMFPGYEEYVAEHIEDFDRVLDVGCGDGTAGYAFFREVWHRINYHGIDPSGVLPAYEYFRAKGKSGNVLLTQTDLFKLRPNYGYHWVFCVGVLHYLPDRAAGLARLTELLNPSGIMVLWVYKKQPPIRELTDQYLRSYFSAMSPENAKKAIEGLTYLGREIGRVSQLVSEEQWSIDLEDIPELGIKAGEYTLHEFFYYYIMKLFYNPALSFERHVVNNWNAFYPKPVEFVEPSIFRTMLGNAGLDIKLWDDKGNGIAVIAEKRAPF